MAKKEISYRANIGSSSLILIFIILCLVTFGMLSLTSAKSDLNLAGRNAEAVKEYYRADREGEAVFVQVSDEVRKICEIPVTLEERTKELADRLGEFYDKEAGTVVTQIPMERDQALLIELIPDVSKAGSVTVKTWKVIQTADLEIDTSMPVWPGVSTQQGAGT